MRTKTVFSGNISPINRRNLEDDTSNIWGCYQGYHSVQSLIELGWHYGLEERNSQNFFDDDSLTGADDILFAKKLTIGVRFQLSTRQFPSQKIHC